jgi:hypothetical protein
MGSSPGADGQRTAAPSMTLAEALRVHFETNGLPADGGYGDPLFTVKLGPLRVALPNGRGRRRAIPVHDVHHVLTGHPTTFRGEAENAAWELGGGCRDYVAAWMLDLVTLGPGVLLWPRRTWRAFVTGRRTGNLYGADFEALQAKPVGDLRRSLGMDDLDRYRVEAADLPLFAGACLAAAPVAVGGFLISLTLMPVAAWRTRRPSSRQR